MMRAGCQSGATLLVVLILLVLITLFAISSMSTSNMNLKVVGNFQARNEAMKSAQETIETVISTPLFTTNPENAIASPCAQSNTLCHDVTGDDTPDYTTTLDPPPTCVAVRPVKLAELTDTSPSSDDIGCTVGTSSGGTLIEGAVTGNSMCSNTVWEITAETSANDGGASVTVIHGVGVRVTASDAATSC